METTWLNLITIDEETGDVLASVGGSIKGFFNFTIGGFDTQLDILLLLMCADVITGTIAGIKNTGFMSSKCRDGITKKIITIILVSVCHMLGVVLELPMIRNAVIIAFVLNETASIFENVENMGYGKIIPEKIRNILKVAKDKKMNDLQSKIGEGKK